MKKPILPHMVVIGVGLALAALLLYSLDRSAWLFTLYETGQPRADLIGLAAAIVIELATIALIAGDGLAEALSEDPATQHALRIWSGRGLVIVLLVQALANLVAGYLRGGVILFQQLGQGWAAYGVAAVAWIAVNAAVPLLIFALAKIESHALRLVLAQAPADAVPGLAQVAQLEDQLAFVQRNLAHAEERADTANALLARATEEHSTLTIQLEHMVERLAQAESASVLPGDLDVLAIAQELRQPRSTGTPWRTIETLVHVPQSTLRRKVEEVRV